MKLIVMLIAMVMAFSSVEAQGFMVGGLSNSRPADSEIKAVLGKVPHQALLKGTNLSASNVSITPVSYASQVVAGTNFFVKLQVDAGSSNPTFLHCRLFRPLPPNHTNIEVVECNQAEKDAPLTYF
jgi:hypothetical protein